MLFSGKDDENRRNKRLFITISIVYERFQVTHLISLNHSIVSSMKQKCIIVCNYV